MISNTSSTLQKALRRCDQLRLILLKHILRSFPRIFLRNPYNLYDIVPKSLTQIIWRHRVDESFYCCNMVSLDDLENMLP